ncbi:hypothetical protein D3C86_1343790 [compost metagenome]
MQATKCFLPLLSTCIIKLYYPSITIALVSCNISIIRKSISGNDISQICRLPYVTSHIVAGTAKRFAPFFVTRCCQFYHPDIVSSVIARNIAVIRRSVSRNNITSVCRLVNGVSIIITRAAQRFLPLNNWRLCHSKKRK